MSATSERLTEDDARVLARLIRRMIQRRPAEQRDGDDDAEGEAAGP